MLASSRKAQEIYAQLDQLNTYHHELDIKLRRLRSDVQSLRVFSSATICSTSRASVARSTAQRIGEFRRTNMATVDGAPRARQGGRRADFQPAGAARRLLGDVRSAVRLDADREVSTQRRLPAARGRAAARSGAGHRPGDRRTEQRQSRRPAGGGRAAARRVPRRSAPVALAERAARPGGGARLVVFRLRVLERRSDEQRSIAAGGGAPDAPAVAAAGRRPGRRTEEPVARAARPRRAGADRPADGARPNRADQGARRRAGSPRRSPNAKQLVDNMFRTVRDLALGLRPSMLDDFGLQPALEWHVRDFIGRYGVDVELSMDGPFDAAARPASDVCLSGGPGGADQLRPAREARQSIKVTRHRPTAITWSVSVTDDGVGSRSRAAPRRPGSAWNRGARQGTSGRR